MAEEYIEKDVSPELNDLLESMALDFRVYLNTGSKNHFKSGMDKYRKALPHMWY